MASDGAGRKIRLGRTAWGVLHALAQNNGRGFFNWGRRYAELSPGRAVVFMQVYHQVIYQQLVTQRGQNAPGHVVLTDRGLRAYENGWIESIPPQGVFLDEAAGIPFTGEIPKPKPHKWAREKDRLRSRDFG